MWNDNVTIFDEIAKGNADLMMTDSSETRYQQKQHPGVLCAVHPDKPFDFAENAYWLQRDIALKAFAYYCERGYQDGSALEDWLRAERELLRTTKAAPRRRRQPSA